jgi:D-inositol-3-phosphate glycosyltransferase
LANIIILGSAYPLRGGGMATFNERLAREFMAEGHHVTIFTFSLQYPNFLFPGKSQYTDEQAPEDLNIHVKINSINPFNWIKVGRELCKLRPDVLIIRYWMPFMAPCLGSIGKLVKRNKHTRIIAITDNVIPHEKRWFDRILTWFFIKQMHGFVTMSESVLNDLRSFKVSKDQYSLCLHPLYDNYGDPVPQEKAREVLDINKDCQLVLFFGFVRAYKGLDLLIEAFGSETLRTLPVKLLVAGEFYTSLTPYLNLINKLKLNDRVILHNRFVANDLVKYYFCASDLVAQPYKEATQSGVSQVAYHFNVPMVVTRVGGLPEMVPHMKAGYVVDTDPENIAAAIADYFTNNKKDTFIRGILSEKKRFSWSNLTKTILYQAEKKTIHL